MAGLDPSPALAESVKGDEPWPPPGSRREVMRRNSLRRCYVSLRMINRAQECRQRAQHCERARSLAITLEARRMYSIWHNSGASWPTKWSSLNERLVERPQPSDNTNVRAGRCFLLVRPGDRQCNKGPAAFAVGQRVNLWQIPARSGRLTLRHRILPQPLCVRSDSHGVTLRISAVRAGNMTLTIIWLMMGLRFMGASPSQEGKWLPYQFALGHCGPYLRLIAVSSSALYARR